MNKKKILKKLGFSLADIEQIDIEGYELTELKPEEYFKEYKNVAEALLQSLIDNDTDAFKEILDSYLRVNRSKIAKNTDLSRSTVSTFFSKNSNPTIKTIAKIVHEASIENKIIKRR